MRQIELKKKITDATGFAWRATETSENDWRFELTDLSPSALEVEPEVEIRYVPEAKALSVWTTNNLLMDVVPLDEMKRRLKLTVIYGQFAKSISEHWPEVANLVNPTHCRALIEALIAFGEKDPAFTGSQDGITFWIGDGFLVEFNTELDSYVLWNAGDYWVAATPEGLINTYSDALIHVEQMSKIQLD